MDSDHHRHAREEEGRITPTLPPFVRPGSLHTPHLLSNVIGSKDFQVHLILTPQLMPKEQNQITMRKVCSVIQPPV